jgi:hypothetical protein
MDFDTLRKTGLGLGVEADFLATLASDPPEAVSRKFDSICILRDIPLEWFALFTTKLKLLSLSLLFFASIHVRSEEFPFVNLKPSKNAKALARGVYMPLEDEAPF